MMPAAQDPHCCHSGTPQSAIEPLFWDVFLDPVLSRKIKYRQVYNDTLVGTSGDRDSIVLYLIEAPFNTFANRVDPDQTALTRGLT